MELKVTHLKPPRNQCSHGFKGQFVIIGKIEDVESEWGLYDEMKVSSYKVVVINDIVLKS